MKKSSIRRIALAIVLIMVLGLVAACAPAAPTPPPAPATPTPPAGGGDAPAVGIAPEVPEAAEGANFSREIDIIIDNNNIAVLNPFNPASNQAPNNWTFVMIYDRLLNIAGEGRFSPGLAVDWQTDDYQTFNFTLRQGVTFHNGDPFTAEDVAWTIEASRDGIGSQAHDQWRPIVEVNVISRYEIQFVLDDVNVDFYFNMAMPMAGIVNRRAMTEDPENGTWIGTGAFMVYRFVSGDYVVMRRNDNWWNNVENGGERTVPTEQVTLRFVPEVPARAIMLRNLEVQLSFSTGAEDTPFFEASPDFTVWPLIFNNPQGLSFNMRHPITGCWYFRRAVMSAVDRAEIAMVAAGEWAIGDTTSGTHWGFATEFRNNDIPMVPYDLERAKYYLERSAWNGETITISTAIVTNIRASEQFQEQMRRIGLPIEINQTDSATLAALVRYGNEEKQMSFFNTLMSMNSGSVRHAFVPYGAQNRGSYNNPIVTDMFNEARRTTDIDARRAIYMEIQEIIAEDPPLVNIHWRKNPIIGARGVGGMYLPNDHHHTDLRGVFWDLDA